MKALCFHCKRNAIATGRLRKRMHALKYSNAGGMQ
jgi:hypothetical protein